MLVRQPHLPFKGELALGMIRSHKPFTTWRPDGTESWLLVYTVAGTGRIGHASGNIAATEGEAVLIRPGTPHDFSMFPNSRYWHRLWAHFEPHSHWYEWFGWPELASGLMKITISDRTTQTGILRNFKEAILQAGSHVRRRDDFTMNFLEKVLLLCDAANPKLMGSVLDPRISKALNYLSRNLSKPITLDELTRHCGLSVSRFSYLFQQQIHQTPQQFIEIQRLNRAQQLLRFTDQPVAEIGRDVGYPDPFYFSLRFKRHFKLSPRAYRKDHCS